MKSDLRASGFLRRANSAGAFATIARRGDADAGALYIKVWIGAGRAHLWMQARDDDGGVGWREPLGPESTDAAVDEFLAREVSFDPDLWVIEIEDRAGRAFLD